MAIIKRLDQVKKTALEQALETLPQVAMSYMQSVNMEKAQSTQKALKLMETLATNSSSFASGDQYEQALNMMEGMQGTLKGDNYGSMLLNNYIETTGRNYKNMLANQDMKASLSAVGTQASNLATEYQTGALGEIMTTLDDQLTQFSGQLTKDTITAASDKKEYINNLMNLQNTLQLFDTSSADPSFDWRVTNSYWDQAVDMLKDPNADMGKVNTLVGQGRDYLYKHMRDKYNEEYTMFGSEISNLWSEGTQEEYDEQGVIMSVLWNKPEVEGFSKVMKQGYFGRLPGSKVKLTESTADEFKDYHQGFFKELINVAGGNEAIKDLANKDGGEMMHHLSKTVINKILEDEGLYVDPQNFKTVMKKGADGSLTVESYDWRDVVTASDVKEFIRDNMLTKSGLFDHSKLINEMSGDTGKVQYDLLLGNISGIIANQLLGWNKIDQFEKDAEYNFQSNILDKGGEMDPLSLQVGDTVNQYEISKSGQLNLTNPQEAPENSSKNLVTKFDPETGEPMHQEIVSGSGQSVVASIVNEDKDARKSELADVLDQMQTGDTYFSETGAASGIKEGLLNEYANNTEYDSIIGFLMDPKINAKLTQMAKTSPEYYEGESVEQVFTDYGTGETMEDYGTGTSAELAYGATGDYGPTENQGAATQFAQLVQETTGISGQAADYQQGPLSKIQSELIALGNIAKTNLQGANVNIKNILGTMPDAPDIPLSEEISNKEIMEQLLNIIPGSGFEDKIDMEQLKEPGDLYHDLRRKDAMSLIAEAVDAAEGFTQAVGMEDLVPETELAIEYPDDTMGNYIKSLDEVANAEAKIELLQSELDEMNAQAHAYWMTPEGQSGTVMDARGVIVPEQETLESFTRMATSAVGVSGSPYEGIDPDKYNYHTDLMNRQTAHANQIQVLKDQVAFGQEMIKKDMSNLSGAQLNTIREAERMGLSPSEYLKQFPRNQAMDAKEYYDVRIGSIDKQLPPLRIALKKAQNRGDTGEIKNIKKQIARLGREQKALKSLQQRLAEGLEVPTYIRGQEYPWWLLEWSDSLDRDINRYNEVEMSR